MRHGKTDGRFLGWVFRCDAEDCDYWTADSMEIGLINDGAGCCPNCNQEATVTDFHVPWATAHLAEQLYYCDHEYDSYCGKCGLAS